MVIVVLVVLVLIGVGAFMVLKAPAKSPQETAFGLLRAGQFKEIIDLLDEPYRQNNLDPYVNYYLGIANHKTGNKQAALKHLRNVLNIGQFDTEIDELETRKAYALLAYQIGDFTESFHEFKNCHSKYPEDVESNAYMGFMLIGGGLFDEALPFLQKIANYEQDNMSYQIAYGVCEAEVGNVDKARSVFKTALRNDPGHAQTGLLLAILDVENENYAQAAQSLEKAIDGAGDDYVRYLLHRLLGFCYYHTKSAEQAISNLRSGIKLSTDNKWKDEMLELSYFLGLIACQYKQLDVAHEMFLNVEVENPNYKMVQEVAKFRSDYEDNLARPDKRNDDGFLFEEHFADFLRQYIPRRFLYGMSGLKSNNDINFESRADSGKSLSAMMGGSLGQALEDFNFATGDEFENKCRHIASNLGFTIEQFSPPLDDGLDAVGSHNLNKTKGFFQFKQWGGQLISDLFLRNLEDKVKTNGCTNGYLVASSSLTEGAMAMLEDMPSLHVINEKHLEDILSTAINN